MRVVDLPDGGGEADGQVRLARGAGGFAGGKRRLAQREQGSGAPVRGRGAPLGPILEVIV